MFSYAQLEQKKIFICIKLKHFAFLSKTITKTKMFS